MKKLGLLAILCSMLSTSAVDLATAAPGGPGARPSVDNRQRAMDRKDKLERVESKILDHVQRVDSERYETLIFLKTNRPRAYRHLMIQSGKMLKFKDRDRDIEGRFFKAIDLTAEMGELADGYHGLSPAQQAKRRAKMESVASQMFELKQDAQRARLAAMEARLSKIRQSIADKDAAKEDVVDNMVDRILTPKRKRAPR